MIQPTDDTILKIPKHMYMYKFLQIIIHIFLKLCNRLSWMEKNVWRFYIYIYIQRKLWKKKILMKICFYFNLFCVTNEFTHLREKKKHVYVYKHWRKKKKKKKLKEVEVMGWSTRYSVQRFTERLEYGYLPFDDFYSSWERKVRKIYTCRD